AVPDGPDARARGGPQHDHRLQRRHLGGRRAARRDPRIGAALPALRIAVIRHAHGRAHAVRACWKLADRESRRPRPRRRPVARHPAPARGHGECYLSATPESDMNFSGTARLRASLFSWTFVALAACPLMSAQVASAATAASGLQCTPGGAASLPDFSPLVAKYGPAVVNIEVIEKQPEGGDQGNDPLNDFFRRFGIPAPGGGQQRHEEPVRGAGSGFIVSPDGYILTNGHVVEGASQVTVRLVDQREFKARVVGTDERTDIAVLKIAATGLPVVRFGDPSKLRPGEWVLAIGSPFGFDNSATAGIVSAIGRSLPTENYVPFIQTDVAVNP